MKRFIDNYGGETFDVIVIGGGITGAAVAYDAASRGLSVALVEKTDFGHATSAATSKLIHGGFRYIANMEFAIVRESLRERRTLENIAPNLVYPIEVLVPCYDSGITKHTGVFRLGMLLFDMLSYDKAQTWDKSKKIRPHTTMTPERALEREPAIPRKGLKTVFSYYDCASLFPERLTLAFIKSAVKHGASVANYCKVQDFLFSGTDRKKITGVKVKDLIMGQDVDLHGTLVINCGGPWADLILDKAMGHKGDKRIRRSEGIHIITRPIARNSMIAMVTSKGGGFVIEPWRGHALIGPTDKDYAGDPDDYRVTKQAIMELIENVNGTLCADQHLEYDDVLHTYGGLRPLVDDSSESVRESSRRYEIHDNAEDGFDGLITVEGGKYTTSRNLAQNAMKVICRKLDKNGARCITDKQHLAGCEIKDLDKFLSHMKAAHRDFSETTVDRLARYYGTDCGRVLDIARKDKTLVEPLNNDGEIAAQAVFAIREEMAQTLKDILMRRTGLGTLGNPGDTVIESIADLAARELEWDDTRKEKEIKDAKALFVLPS